MLMISGCAVGGSQEPSLDDGLLTRSLDGDGAERDAIVGGKLILDPIRGCILLSGKPVVWPAETTVTSDPRELHLPVGLTARPGDTITGGGGELPAAAIRDTALRIDGDLSSALDCAPADSEAVVFTARGHDIRVSSSEPAWVTKAALDMQQRFVGHPEPASVSYRRGAETVSVTLTFGHVVVCDTCSRPAGSASPRGRHATAVLDARTHRGLSFTLSP